jgi:hypothetical protein
MTGAHLDQVEIPTSSRQVHPRATAFEVSANDAAISHPFHAFRRARDIQPTLLTRADEAIEWGSPLLRGSNYGAIRVHLISFL